MEKTIGINEVCLAGRVVQGPSFNHKTYGEAFYMMVLGIVRRSGYEDKIRLIVSEKILKGRSPKEGECLEVMGQIRTYNKESEGRSKLEITVFVKTMVYRKEAVFAYQNHISLEGFICKAPVRRTSPLGRQICDLMIAVNRQYNKSDYVPSIAWGRNAMWCECLNIGDKVTIEGRIQSREYRKYTDSGEAVVKTAYEVSVVKVEFV
ncbi:MAG: single-stranded DNA-binding protein [Bacillota bacterium]|nr:single-stranded DNA-binding protein [Bacillota bacterium]